MRPSRPTLYRKGENMSLRYARRALSQQELDDIFDELEEELVGVHVQDAVRQLETWRERKARTR